MNTIPVLLNPSSGGGRGGKLGRSRLESALNRNGLDHKIYITRSEAHLRQLARGFSRSGGWLVIAGGDTSFRIAATEILNASLDPGSAPSLGLYASGSVNDIVRGLGVGNADSLCGLISKNRTRTMDVGRVRFTGDRPPEYFIGSLSMGLGVAVNREVVRKRGSKGRSLGGWGHGIAAMRNAFRSPEVPLRVHITADGKELHGSFTLVSFMNTPHFAGGLRPAPGASPFDGRLDAVCVSTINWWNTVIAGVGLVMGVRRGFKMRRSASFHVCAEVDFHVQLDGDVIHAGSECVIDLAPAGLRIASGCEKGK